jgi:hypothetical protein
MRYRSYRDPQLLLLIMSINDKLILEVGDIIALPEFLQKILFVSYVFWLFRAFYIIDIWG